ncbi:sensor histidine kinase [Tengunoibacter tsumagoiensis]|uniref:Histidine kinase/HSP90-like ATPase domain-containing protein n=1 Tax=Tengunoibacter tsumagoiensis TaxID=2014871 RepID=A0A401ZYH5_9CHLR|nr:hypothetical protein [Tengunoibacter tsumagoiensis]GCE11918.1 hypothetical protein KTT_17770 [Tengunoibacter tsumagoiensis]
MLDWCVPTGSLLTKQTTEAWWQRMRPPFMAGYLVVTLLLICISGLGHLRLLSEVGSLFGGFTWVLDPDTNGEIVIISTPPQLPPFALSAQSLTNTTHIVAVNRIPGREGIQRAYAHGKPQELITYTATSDNGRSMIIIRPAVIFTADMWWQTYGLTFLAGLSWLVVGAFLLMTSTEWSGAVEGITLLPPAMLLLLYSHWGNIQQANTPDLVIQLLWIPAFALLGSTFIHLSLTYRPEALGQVRTPHIALDGLPYLPLIALFLYEWLSLLLLGHVPMRPNIIISLGYGALGGLISLTIGARSLLRILFHNSPWRRSTAVHPIPDHIRHRLGDLLTLWIGGVGLGFCLGVLPILLTGQTLLPLPIFYILATVYPLILLYAIRSLRLMEQLHLTLEQREQALLEQQRTAEELLNTNKELSQATSLLLHADTHLRSLLSQRIHDQPKQQALRIRSLLGYWQHKLALEAERDPSKQTTMTPIIKALGTIRHISEELEGDLRGLQLLVEDVYQRRSMGLKFHLDKLIQEDLPALHPESPLKIQTDLWSLDVLSPDLEQSVEGMQIAEAISYTITQSLLNIYNHAGCDFATVSTSYAHNVLEVEIRDTGKGFSPEAVSPEKTTLFKAQLKAREAGGELIISSHPRPEPEHGTTVTLRIPLPPHVQK